MKLVCVACTSKQTANVTETREIFAVHWNEPINIKLQCKVEVSILANAQAFSVEMLTETRVCLSVHWNEPISIIYNAK